MRKMIPAIRVLYPSLGLLVLLMGTPAPAQNPLPIGLKKIRHIVFIVKENRSFDQYFGTFPGVDGATSGVTSSGQIIPLGHTPDALPADICHTWKCQLQQMNYGGMNNFDVLPSCPQNGRLMCYTQMQQPDIPNYFTYAKNFTLGDQMFASLHGTSFPNHLYTVAATAAGFTDQAHLPNQFLSKEPGCEAEGEIQISEPAHVFTPVFEIHFPIVVKIGRPDPMQLG